MSNRSSDLVVIICRVYQETDSAILVGEVGLITTDTDNMEWIPSSLISHSKELQFNKREIEIPRWLMEKKELEYLEK